MFTSLLRVSSPEEMPIDRAVVFAHLRSIPFENGQAPDDADYIDGLIEMAVDRLDGPNGLLNRALISQVWKANYAAFPVEIPVPLARCTAIQSVTYLDVNGAAQTLATPAYRITGLNTDNARIRPVNGTAWPTTCRDGEAVTVTFTSGFGADAEDIPGSIRHAILEAVARAYAYSEPVIDGRSFSSLPGSATTAVTDWRVWPE
ncbi:MAG TPA: hypothetical protein VGM83_05775 [Devosiaceae bacterium]|jgi:uncharacterized phiE125 gp8 family phage protein